MSCFAHILFIRRWESMLRLALCDDDPQQRASVGALLQEYAALRPALAAKLSIFSSSWELLADEEEGACFDLYPGEAEGCQHHGQDQGQPATCPAGQHPLCGAGRPHGALPPCRRGAARHCHPAMLLPGGGLPPDGPFRLFRLRGQLCGEPVL